MKSKITRPAPKPYVKPSYPYLGEYIGETSESQGSFVVLFTDKDEGVVVQSKNTSRPLGMNMKNWWEPSFTALNGSVTLSNDGVG